MSVYFVATECRQFVKIGRTGQLEARLKALRNSCPLRLDVLKVLPGRQVTERVYHETFSDSRIHGEWFRADDEMLKFIDQLNPDWSSGDTDP